VHATRPELGTRSPRRTSATRTTVLI